MKVLHVLYSGLGGHGSVFFSMVAADKNKEFEYAAVFNGIEDIREEYILRCKEHGIPYSFVKKKPGKHLSFYHRLFKAIKSHQPDVIFLHGSMAIGAAYAAKKLGRNCKIVVRETQALHMKTGADKASFRMAFKLADNIVFLSAAYQEEVRRAFGKSFLEQKVSLIPNGIDLSYYSPPGVIDHNGTVKIGMQSRIVAIKDHLTLVRAFKILVNNPGLPAVSLYIAGDGEYKDRVEAEISTLELQDKIHLVGMLPESRLANFLQSLDIYIHASLGETMSTAIMQAMACRLPVIASDVDGINNMIDSGKTGLLVPPKDERQLASAIETLIVNSDLKNEIAEAGLGYAKEHFSNTRMFLSYRKLFLS